MSGDVQPRKRKDKKRKKDDLGVEEPRGTAAVFGEGDVFMHSPHDHSTGGHWCAKIIFFSLLAVLITLIGLIILENRGLTELEANSVESRYSGVLEGWIDEAPDDDHHDEHTLELKHHDEEESDHNGDNQSDEIEQDEDEEDHEEENDDDIEQDDDNEDELDDDNDNEQDDEDEVEQDDEDEDKLNEEDEDEQNEEDEVEQDDDMDHDDETEDNEYDQENDEHDEDSEEKNLETPDHEDEVEERISRKYYDSNEHHSHYDNNDDDDDRDNQKIADDQTVEEDDIDNIDSQQESNENNDDNYVDDNNDNDDIKNDNESETRDNEDEDEIDNAEEDIGIEVERIEREVSEEDSNSMEQPTSETEDDQIIQEVSKEDAPEDGGDDSVEFLEPDEFDDAPVVEHIIAPPGKPLAEVEESSSEKPLDTLAEEEEYEKQQEALRREKEQASQSMWLKLAVGGALLVATHAVVRRATAPGDANGSELDSGIEESPSLTDRRMTLIPVAERASPPVTNVEPELPGPIIEKEIARQTPLITKTSPITKEESDNEEEEEAQEIKHIEAIKTIKDKELYSDDEEVEDEEEEIQEEKAETPKQNAPVEKDDTPESEPEEIPDDVEIIDDEQLEDELEEEDVEEEISDVDDADLLSRLEAKYGRLPEPERPGQKHKEGGNSIEDEWPGEPSDPYWRQQLDQAERELREGSWSAAEELAGAAALRDSGRARWVMARALDAAADARRDNRLLGRAIAAYLHLLKMNERLSDGRLIEVADRTLDRIKFRGNYLNAEPVYRLLIRRFPDRPSYRNDLSVSFLMANRADLAEEVLGETLRRWPDDRVALAHRGFVLKTQHNRLEEAVDALQRALEGDAGAASEPRFYYHLGDALLLLGRLAEAHEVHRRGAALGHFLSPAQRSLYNVERLRSRPWWNAEETPYARLARALENSWKDILREGEAARALYEREKEGLRERGEWSQLDLFVRGREVPERCARAPMTCAVVRAEAAAAGCRRGQVKFSSMEAGTHVRPHVGPTNCRLRMHLGLSNTKDTYIRVDQETRQWQNGKVLMFDDSFEHEVWHNGTGTRLVLIVDVWHPDLTPAERRQLPAI